MVQIEQSSKITVRINPCNKPEIKEMQHTIKTLHTFAMASTEQSSRHFNIFKNISFAFKMLKPLILRKLQDERAMRS